MLTIISRNFPSTIVEPRSYFTAKEFKGQFDLTCPGIATAGRGPFRSSAPHVIRDVTMRRTEPPPMPSSFAIRSIWQASGKILEKDIQRSRKLKIRPPLD